MRYLVVVGKTPDGFSLYMSKAGTKLEGDHLPVTLPWAQRFRTKKEATKEALRREFFTGRVIKWETP